MDVTAEVQFHLDAQIEALSRLGMPPDLASAQARREFGDLDKAKDDLCRLDQRNGYRTRQSEYLSQFQ